MPSTKQFTYRRLWNVLRYRVYSRLYRDTDRDLRKSIMVAGAARSGTTWLAQIVAYQVPARIMFEPFHAGLVPDYSPFNYFQYRRPDDSDDELYAYCRRVFTGSIRHPWIDRKVDTLTPQIRIVKEIRANLFLKWINKKFPNVPILFIVRHPCAVVNSRLRLGWATDGDIEPLLAQSELVNDYLADKIDVIKGASSPEEKHAIVWCVNNLIPLRQFARGELNIIFYEYLCVYPEREISRVFDGIDRNYDPSILAVLDEPSMTAKRTSAVVQGGDRVSGWQAHLTTKQIEAILSVVAAFELDNLYGDSVFPLVRENSLDPIASLEISGD
jgi:hypothetical protein